MLKTITVIASLALAFTAKGDYVIKEQLETSGQTQQITLKIKDAKVRADIGEQNSALIDSNKAETTLLLHAQKAFLKINPQQLQSQAQALKDLLGTQTENSGDIELKPTGKKETINGFDTEEYTTNFHGVQMSIFVAKQFPNYRKLVEALYRVQSGPAMDLLRALQLFFLLTPILWMPGSLRGKKNRHLYGFQPALLSRGRGSRAHPRPSAFALRIVHGDRNSAGRFVDRLYDVRKVFSSHSLLAVIMHCSGR